MSQPTKKAGGSKTPAKAVGVATNARAAIFPGCLGLLLGLSLLKFGNPIILERMVTWPEGIYEWILTSWPLQIGHWLLFAVTVVGLLNVRWKSKVPWFLVALPLLWLMWELLAGLQAGSARQIKPTLLHFLCCVDCFYLGYFALSGSRRIGAFWAGLIPPLFLVFVSGFQQHFGGLEDSRKFFMYMYSHGQSVDPTFMKKLNSGRIFGTLFYPNTLAEAILLLLPVTLAVLWSLRERFTIGARQFLVGAAALAALACLYWSGSKGGWLLTLVIFIIGAMFLPIKRQIKIALVVAVLFFGMAGFTAKYLGFFKKGATSVVARFDYWQAALKTTAAKPVFGTGPGTFGTAYEKLKRPESEMALLTHNDYLEQASDSGLPGCALFVAAIAGILIYTWRHGKLNDDWVRLAVWLGVLGWALQNFIEFGLYIPALSWTAFALMGWLLGESGNQFDTARPVAYNLPRQ